MKVVETTILLAILFLHSFVQSQYNVMDTSDCVFPFVYNGKKYDSCITNDRFYSWCSLTDRYQGVWKYCQDMTKTDWVCSDSCNHDEYPSCTSTNGKQMYCLDKILDLSKKPVGSCAKEFKEISRVHTACLPSSKNVAKRGLSHQEMEEIVELHNRWRRSVDVPAAGMQKMYWDNELAVVAQKHADRCSFSHDDSHLRSMPFTGRNTGQNIVMVHDANNMNFTKAFDVMFKGELKRWDYGTGIKPIYKGKHALHLTQILIEKASRVGCGYAECVYVDRLERVFVCNYNYIQNTAQAVTPYTKGSWCEKCPNRCDDKLCDCGGMECYNGGELDLHSCTCKCKGLWKGAKCQEKLAQKIDEATGCYSPFSYKGELYYGCTLSDGNGGFICSLTPEYKGDDNYVYCDDDRKRGLDEQYAEDGELYTREDQSTLSDQENDLNDLLAKAYNNQKSKPVEMDQEFRFDNQNGFDDDDRRILPRLLKSKKPHGKNFNI